MHCLSFVALSIAIRGIQCFNVAQRVFISGIGDSEFAEYQTMNNRHGIITEIHIMHQGQTFSRVRLPRFPFAECVIPNDNLTSAPNLDALPLETRALIAQNLDAASSIRFGFTSHGNNHAMLEARRMGRGTDLEKIKTGYAELFEVTCITPEMILDSFTWFPPLSVVRHFERSTLKLGRRSYADSRSTSHGKGHSKRHLMVKTGDQRLTGFPVDFALFEFRNGKYCGMHQFITDCISTVPLEFRGYSVGFDSSPQERARHLASFANLILELL